MSLCLYILEGFFWDPLFWIMWNPGLYKVAVWWVQMKSTNLTRDEQIGRSVNHRVGICFRGRMYLRIAYVIKLYIRNIWIWLHINVTYYMVCIVCIYVCRNCISTTRSKHDATLVTQSQCAKGSTDLFTLINSSTIYTPEIYHSNVKSTIWRCISYSRWGFSIAMFVYRRVSILGMSSFKYHMSMMGRTWRHEWEWRRHKSPSNTQSGWKNRRFSKKKWRQQKQILVGGFKRFFIFTPNPGEMIQFDEHICSKGLVQPPSR